MDERFILEWDNIKEFMVTAFRKAGLPKEDALICTDVLMESDRRGIESHGVNRFKPIYIDRIEDGILNPKTTVDTIKETPTTAVLDGNNGMGMVVSKQAMQLAIDKAKEYGMGMVVVRNSTHYGIAGYYASMATKQGCIGMTGTNARPSIAPTFGVENMLGTNPLTVGLPTDEEFDFILDCATSITQRGKIEFWARNNQDTPSGLVIDRDNNDLTNSEDILKQLTSKEAALTPLGGKGEDTGGYKGYGYATIVEILSSALQAGQFMHALSGINEQGEKIPYPLGHFFIAINPEAFMGLDTFKKTAGNILRELRHSKKAPGQDKIYTAGEKEFIIWQQRKEKGVPLSKSVQQDLKNVRDSYNIDITFPFE